MVGRQTTTVINIAIAQRIAFAKTIAAAVVTRSGSYTTEELSRFIDRLFEVSDEIFALMEKNQSALEKRDDEEMSILLNGLALMELIEALERAPADTQLAAEKCLNACALINPRLKRSIETELLLYQNNGSLFDQIKHADKIERLRRLLA